MDAPQILLIDDDAELCELLDDYLGEEGFRIEAANDGPSGLVRAVSEEHALVVLDVMLPGMSGLEVLRRLRQVSAVPVLMLTARGDDVDRIVGLEMGADDYLAKPFNPRELVARIRAIQRRIERARGNGEAGAGVGAAALRVGDVELNPRTRVVRRAGEEIALTSAEFALLDALLREAGRVVSREELALRVLGRELAAYDRSIDVHVSNLRRKLGNEVAGVERISTVRGVGYQYSATA